MIRVDIDNDDFHLITHDKRHHVVTPETGVRVGEIVKLYGLDGRVATRRVTCVDAGGGLAIRSGYCVVGFRRLAPGEPETEHQIGEVRRG